ncbi:GCN5 family acetyltransferase [bacterium]|nr:GCN5 family acetyltransferase [bacterium]
MEILRHPNAHDQNKVGSYPTIVYSGGGYLYDAVLEYRVWSKSEDGQSICHSFGTYNDAKKFSKKIPDAEKEPVVLVLQKQYIEETKDGKYKLINKERLAEWKVEWLKNNIRSEKNIKKYINTDEQA